MKERNKMAKDKKLEIDLKNILLQFAKEEPTLKNVISVEIDEENGMVYFQTPTSEIDFNQIKIMKWIINHLKLPPKMSDGEIRHRASELFGFNGVQIKYWCKGAEYMRDLNK
jgi:hypothetical protein